MQIQVKNISHIYSEGTPYQSTALSGVNFEIEKGAFVGIIGHTGSGKSTLIQHLNGLLKPKSGNILINGFDITDKDVKMRDIRKQIGLVFQYPEYQLFEETVHKDVSFGPYNLGLEQNEVDQRVVEAISLVGLDYNDIANRSPFELSGGQRRRVAIAGVIAMKPDILILDEPTAGLDPKAHNDLLQMIQKIHQEQGTTVLLVSHNMGDIAKLSTQVFVLEKGRLVLSGTPAEVFQEAELLTSLGLGLPPATELVQILKKKGIQIKESALTIDDAEAILTNLLSTK